MTAQQIIGLALRCFAIFLVLHSIKYLVGLPAAYEANGLSNQAYISYGIGVLLLIISLILWLFPTTIANKIIPAAATENYIKVQARDAARVGGSLIGLWVFATEVPGFLWFVFLSSVNVGGGSFIGALDFEGKLSLAFYLCEIALSYFLIFKSNVFASIAMRGATSEPVAADNIE